MSQERSKSADDKARAEPTRRDRSIDKPGDHLPRSQQGKLITVIFENDDEYVRFTDYVYQELGGAGLELTNIPIVASVRVTEQLLEQTRSKFKMRRATHEDLARVREQAGVRAPFDPKNLDGFYVPGSRNGSKPS